MKFKIKTAGYSYNLKYDYEIINIYKNIGFRFKFLKDSYDEFYDDPYYDNRVEIIEEIEIDINSLEELLEFIKTVKNDIVISIDDENYITIYDYYLE